MPGSKTLAVERKILRQQSNFFLAMNTYLSNESVPVAINSLTAGTPVYLFNYKPLPPCIVLDEVFNGKKLVLIFTDEPSVRSVNPDDKVLPFPPGELIMKVGGPVGAVSQWHLGGVFLDSEGFKLVVDTPNGLPNSSNSLSLQSFKFSSYEQRIYGVDSFALQWRESWNPTSALHLWTALKAPLP